MVRIIRQIAEGGFAFVYLCEGSSLGGNSTQKFALKKILAQTREATVSAQSEIDNHRRFGPKSKHVLGLIDSVILQRSNVGTEYWLLFPFMDRGSIADRIQASPTGRLRESEALHLFLGLCMGLSVFHEAAVAHRDINPRNVLVNDQDEAILMDFGSAAPARQTMTR